MPRTPKAAGPFAVGDRVRISDRGHPWAGHTGTIRSAFTAESVPDLKWIVTLDSWGEAAVAERDIRHAAD